MSRNIEIKARIASCDALQPQVAALSTEGPFLLEQDDTFFHCPTGRLKLRAFAAGNAHEAQLIWYRRPDQAGPKESEYLIVPTMDPDALRAALSRAYGQAGRVRKQRRVYLAGRTRIHLDRVEGLGDFMELEVVLAEEEDTRSGVEEAEHILERLGIARADLVEGAYLDLLATAHGTIASSTDPTKGQR
ncbi:MAG TPA: class IV adenylate cyclase [Noviherbaspirillum sp.]|jgi:adenylate cyclase|uniref:class IV adenylate cyclase n=1 Tax=Noviherbaspirillum sp. TaxID=1926288 RepID=UPI002F9557F9